MKSRRRTSLDIRFPPLSRVLLIPFYSHGSRRGNRIAPDGNQNNPQ
jgi:hypothetical protein